MMNDKVREDLQIKVSAGRIATAVARAPMPAQPPLPEAQPAPAKKRVTTDLVSQKTSKTLIAFQGKNVALPDWRMQLHNAVKQRKGVTQDGVADTVPTVVSAPPKGAPPTASPVVSETVATAPNASDLRVANAMRRITESRNTFLPAQANPTTAKPAPLGVVAPKSSSFAAAPAHAKIAEKPVLVATSSTAPKRDTNKLPRLETVSEPVELKSVPDAAAKKESGPLARVSSELYRIHIHSTRAEIDDLAVNETDADDIEDLAPFSMRFGAGLFDVIVAGVVTMVLFSPMAFSSGTWFTTNGMLTFGAAFGLLSFIYLTTGLAFFGKTVGMRLFQLELVDALENAYPTMRQAAVNSALFLIAMPLGGAGFLTVFFNEEKRALHDLLSGTILVREF